MMSLAIRLSEHRIRMGHTKKEAAKELGVSRATVHAWESGTPPRSHQIARIAAYLGIDPIKLQRCIARD